MFDYIDFTLQLVVGIFFALSGFRKSFTAAGRRRVFGVFAKYGVPTAAGWAVVLGEFFGGLGLLFGTLSAWAALGLIPIMVGAFKMSTIPAVRDKHPRGWSGWVVGLLCTPEALLLTIVTSLAIEGLF